MDVIGGQPFSRYCFVHSLAAHSQEDFIFFVSLHDKCSSLVK